MTTCTILLLRNNRYITQFTEQAVHCKTNCINDDLKHCLRNIFSSYHYQSSVQSAFIKIERGLYINRTSGMFEIPKCSKNVIYLQEFKKWHANKKQVSLVHAEQVFQIYYAYKLILSLKLHLKKIFYTFCQVYS